MNNKGLGLLVLVVLGLWLVSKGRKPLEFYNLPAEFFSPWNYAVRIDDQWAITGGSYSRARLDCEQGIITEEQLVEVQALFGQVMP